MHALMLMACCTWARRQLNMIKPAFQEKLQHVEGPVIRPAVDDKTHQTKKNYSQSRARLQLRQCSAFKERNKRVHKGSSSHHSKVGIQNNSFQQVVKKRLDYFKQQSVMHLSISCQSNNSNLFLSFQHMQWFRLTLKQTLQWHT